MKMRLMLFLVAVSFMSCSTDGDQIGDIDSLFFGTFFGECLGESCIEIYKMEDGMLYEDSLDEYPSSTGNAYDWILKPDSDYLLSESLLSSFPFKLETENDIIIGMPDAGDWGGVYLGIERDGELDFWLVDYMDQNIPDYLVDYTSEVKRIVNELK